MDLLPPETIVEIMVKLPIVAQWVAAMTNWKLRAIINQYVIKLHTVSRRFISYDQNDECYKDYITGRIRAPLSNSRSNIRYEPVTTIAATRGEVIEYICSCANINLYNMITHNGVLLSRYDCREYGRINRNPVILANLTKMTLATITWDDLHNLDTYDVGPYGNRIENRDIAISTRFITYPGLTIDWWGILGQVNFSQYTTISGLMWVHRNRLTDNDIKRVKLILAKIMVDGGISRDDMFVKIAELGIQPHLYKILNEIFTDSSKYHLSYVTTAKILQYSSHYETANTMGILPPVGIEYLMSKSNDYEEVEKVAACLPARPRLCYIIDRNDKITYRYFNAHRADVQACFMALLDYAKAARMTDVIKSLNGFRNSRFSQLYDFVGMKVSNNRKIFTRQRK